MSGIFLARVSALSLVMFLAACGGDENSSNLAGSEDSGSNGGGSTTGGGSTNEDSQTVTLGLGSGSGDSFIEGQIETDINDLSAGGQTKLRVYIVNKSDGNSLVTDQGTQVSFSSTCISLGEATINSPITTSTGIAETTYTANGCAPTDLIEAKADTATASVSISIAPPTADRVVSVPLTTNSIAPSGAGTTSRPSETRVTFNVVDDNGDGVRGIDVNFRLSGDDPAAAIPVTLGTTSTTSSTGGEVSTLVIAGSASTVVRVVATIDTIDGPRSTESEPIAINSLIPVESGFTLAADNFIPDAQFTAGVPVTLTVYATDKNGQNIRGNTVVNFTADGGSVIPECTLNNDGVCSVEWRSQAPWLTKPTITASTIGETSSGDVGTIFETITLFVSSSRDPEVTLSAGAEPKQFCASTSVRAADNTRIHPADGTTVSFSGNQVTLLSAKTSFEVNGSSGTPDNEAAYETCVFAELTDPATPGTLNVTVTTPGDEIAEDLLNL